MCPIGVSSCQILFWEHHADKETHGIRQAAQMSALFVDIADISVNIVVIPFSCWRYIPANTRHSPNAVSMLAHRLRRWPNIETALSVCWVCHASVNPSKHATLQ